MGAFRSIVLASVSLSGSLNGVEKKQTGAVQRHATPEKRDFFKNSIQLGKG